MTTNVGTARRIVTIMVIAVGCTAIGLTAGWFATRQAGASHTEGHDHDHASALGATSRSVPKISPQAVANLGLKTAPVGKSTFYKQISIPAVVIDAPQSSLPVHAPLPGRITGLKVVPGEMIAPGTVILTILRDAVPRPQLRLTEEVLKPANEDFHRVHAELRKTIRNLELVRAEVDRVKKFAESGTQDGLPLLPRKGLIDLQYEASRIEKEVENARAELKRHGLTEDEIRAIEVSNELPVLGLRLWRRALEQAGLWTTDAQAIEKALTDDVRNLPWTIATIAELSAAGLASSDLAAWLKDTPGAARKFLEIGALLQQGETLPRVRHLYEQGALEPVVEIKAPPLPGAEQWDVAESSAKPGEHLDTGTRVAVLKDPSFLYLRTHATGSDTATLLEALKKDAELTAIPLSQKTAPALKGLRITRISSPSDQGESEAVLRVPNEVWHIREEEGRRFRTWSLRSGQKYLLRVPAESFEGVFVLPADAVTDEGPDKIVFVEDSHGFEPAKVVVLYQDKEVAVIDPSRSELAVGADVVQNNAFGLGLALKALTGKASDPHAGHQH